MIDQELDVDVINRELYVDVNRELDVDVINQELDVDVINQELDVDVINQELDVDVIDQELDALSGNVWNYYLFSLTPFQATVGSMWGFLIAWGGERFKRTTID